MASIPIPLDKPSTSDGVLRVAPEEYAVGWARENGDGGAPAPPLRKKMRLGWGRSLRKKEKEKAVGDGSSAGGGSRSPLSSLFARFKR
jgi:hypothetical protein